MLKIKNEKGVTMLVLVITIIVLIILAGISINLAIQDADFTIEKKQKTELEEVAHAIYQQYIKYKQTGTEEYIIGDEYEGDTITINSDLNGNTASSTITKTDDSTKIDEKWYRLSTDDLEKIGIQNSKYTYIVKYSTGEVYNETSKESEQNKDTLYINLSE